MLSRRRQFIKGVTAAGSIPLIAGCAGDGEDGGGDTGGGDSGGDGSGGETGGDEPDYPTEDMQWLIGASAGGGFDTAIRGFVEHVPDYLDADIDHVVENVSPPREGFLELYRAEPDGYTIGTFPFEGEVGEYATGADIPNPADLTSLVRLITTEYVIVAGANSGIESIEDLENAGSVRWSTPGEGTTAWLSSIIATGLIGIEGQFVNFEGTSEAITAVLREDVEVTLGPYTTPPIAEAMREGDAIPLVVFSEEVPDVAEGAQTAAEAGYEEFLSINLDRALFGPPDMPEDRVEILADAFLETLDSEGMQQWAEDNDEMLNPAGPEELDQIVQEASELAEEFEDLLSDPDQG